MRIVLTNSVYYSLTCLAFCSSRLLMLISSSDHNVSPVPPIDAGTPPPDTENIQDEKFFG